MTIRHLGPLYSHYIQLPRSVVLNSNHVSHLKNEDFQDYIQSLVVKRGCPMANIDKPKAQWDLIMNRKACMESIRVYKGDKLFSCSLCDIRFTDQCNKNRHRRKVKCTMDDVFKIKWECDICGKCMSSRSSRDRHKRRVHKVSMKCIE